MKNNRKILITKKQQSFNVSFTAMASPCDVIIQSTDKYLAEKVGQTVANEVWRIEDKYSRYDANSVCSNINTNAGKAVAIDEETYLLLNFAEQCYQLSDGLFDISSGVLGKVWAFDGSNKLPTKNQVAKVLSLVGWQKVKFNQQQIILPKGMAIDFGGIGKEYAVDRAIILTKQLTNIPILVNLGGDLAVTSLRHNNEAWQVAVEHPESAADEKSNPLHRPDMIISLLTGALATSGDTHRFLLKAGKRYGHVLNAKTGWPIENAPRTITVVAPTCIQAGILATMSLLQGSDAEKFLTNQDITFWSRR